MKTDMSNEEWVILLNKIIALSTCDATQHIHLGHLTQTFDQLGMDSLDAFLVQLHVVEIFGIPNAIAQTFYPESAQKLIDFTTRHARRKFASAEEAMVLLNSEYPHA